MSKKLDSRKQEAIQNLVDIFAEDWPRKNHVIVIDMTTGAYRVDQMLELHVPQNDKTSTVHLVKEQHEEHPRKNRKDIIVESHLEDPRETWK